MNKRQLLIIYPALILISGALLIMVAMSMSTTIVPAAGGSYAEALTGRPRFINPLLAAPDSIDQDVVSLVFSGLTQTQGAARVVSDLAERWSISGDGKVYTYSLRSGLKWQDGTPLAADDVVYSVNVIQNPSYQGAKEVSELWRNVRAEAPDPLTVRLTLPDKYSPFFEYSTLRILPSHIWKSLPPANHPESDRNGMAIGSGPFKVREASSSRILLDANPLYHLQKPLLAQVEFKYYPTDAAAVDALRKGEVQGVRRLGVDDAVALKNDGRFAVHSTPEVSRVTLLLFNNKNPLLNEKGIRKALALATDRRKLIDEALKGQAVATIGPIPQPSWAYQSEREVYDPDAAKRLLEQAGWKDVDSEGVRIKDGARLQLVLLTNDRPERVAVAQAIARQWKDIGVRVEVQSVGWSGFVKDFLVPRTFHIALAEYWAPNVDPDCYQFWHSSQIEKGLNFSSWANRRVDELLENARRTTEQPQREAMYKEFQTIFADDQPSVMLYHPMYNYVADKSVQGIRLPPVLSSNDRFEDIDEWYSQTKRTFAR